MLVLQTESDILEGTVSKPLVGVSTTSCPEGGKHLHTGHREFQTHQPPPALRCSYSITHTRSQNS